MFDEVSKSQSNQTSIMYPLNEETKNSSEIQTQSSIQEDTQTQSKDQKEKQAIAQDPKSSITNPNNIKPSLAQSQQKQTQLDKTQDPQNTKEVSQSGSKDSKLSDKAAKAAAIVAEQAQRFENLISSLKGDKGQNKKQEQEKVSDPLKTYENGNQAKIDPLPQANKKNDNLKMYDAKNQPEFLKPNKQTQRQVYGQQAQIVSESEFLPQLCRQYDYRRGCKIGADCKLYHPNPEEAPYLVCTCCRAHCQKPEGCNSPADSKQACKREHHDFCRKKTQQMFGNVCRP